MKRICTIVLCISLLLSVIPAIATSMPSYEISLEIPPDNFKVQDITNAYMHIIFDVGRTDTGTYKIEYSIDEWETVYETECVVKPNIKTSKKISLSHLPKGIHEVKVRVLRGEELVAELSSQLSLIEYYKKQPLDKYSSIGMHVAMQAYTGNYTDYQLRLLDLAGITKIRPGWEFEWVNMERTPYYMTDDFYAPLNEKYNRYGFSIVEEFGQQNWKHHTIPKTREDYIALKKYIDYRFNEGKFTIEFAELYNEPDLDIFFPKGDEYAIHYGTASKQLALSIKEHDPDMPIMAASVSGSGESYVGKIVEQGVMPYVDSFAIHPYSATDIDSVLANKMKAYENEVEASGHWLHKYLTELGYPTVQSTLDRATSVEKQSDLVAKTYILADQYGSKGTWYYQFMDVGTDPTSSEAMYGVVKYYSLYSSKPAFAVMPQITKMLNSAQYVGCINLADKLDGHIYWRYGKPLMVAWVKQDGLEVDYEFKDDIWVEDHYGNKIETENMVTFNEHPKYIHGLSDEWFEKVVKQELDARYATWIEKWSDKIDATAITELKNKVQNTPLTKGRTIVSLMNEHYDAGSDIIKKYGKTLEINELALALYQLHEAGEKYGYLYAGIGDVGNYNSVGTYNRWKDKLDKLKKGDVFSTIEFSDKMLNFVKWHSDKAVYIENADDFEGDKEFAQANHLIAIQISKWIEHMSKIEKVNDDLGILAYTSPEIIDANCETITDISYAVDNRTNRQLNGEFVVITDKGEQMFEPIYISIKSGGYQDIDVPINTKGMSAGMHICEARIIENGEIAFKQMLPVMCKTPIKVDLLPSDKVISEYTEIKFNVTNTDENAFNGSIKVKAPDGWVLADDTAEYALQGGETKEISIPIVSKKSKPFNEYLFEYDVCDASGNVIQKVKEMLEFTVIVGADTKISVEDFDGDISDWANAYPVYLNFKTGYDENVGLPDDPTNKESWHNSQLAARSFFKWDANNLYVLVDVYDDAWHQIYSENSLWLGDSVQLAIDTKNDDGKSYQKDDYEITFSDTIPFAQQIYRGTTGNASNNPVGLCPPEWLKVLRDDKDNITRYLLKLPKDSIDPLKLESGYVFGMNVCVNDSDILQRDRFIQVTTGIGDYKLPGSYYDFILGPVYSDEGQMNGLENSTFKIKLDVE